VTKDKRNKGMQQTHMVSTRDPITGRDVEGLARSPFLVEVDEHNELTIYFESEEPRSAYMNLPVEHPGADFSVNLDNPTDKCFEGRLVRYCARPPLRVSKISGRKWQSSEQII